MAAGSCSSGGGDWGEEAGDFPDFWTAAVGGSWRRSAVAAVVGRGCVAGKFPFVMREPAGVFFVIGGFPGLCLGDFLFQILIRAA